MNLLLTDEQAYDLYRFNTAAGQYAPGLYCSLHTSFCTYPAALGGEEFTAASVQVTVYQHPTAESTTNAAVASVPNAPDFDTAMLQMRAQLTAHFGFAPDPADLLPATSAQRQRLVRLANDPRITQSEGFPIRVNINGFTRGQADAKAKELQGFIDSRPLPIRREHQAKPAALHNAA